MKILVMNGPNLNMLGVREPEIYGYLTLSDIEAELTAYAKDLKNVELEFYQSNSEGDIVTKIQEAINDTQGIIINPAAYTHTSIAIADALKAVHIPAVEVHLSNINTREEYRKKSFTAEACIGEVAGFKQDSYKMALFGLYNHLLKS